MTRASTPEPPRIRALDGARGLAVLLVLWAHVPVEILGRPLAVARRVLVPGQLGVDVFFVLSGFLITRILIAGVARGDGVASFYFRRFVRIFPIYYLVVAITAVVRPGAYVRYGAL